MRFLMARQTSTPSMWGIIQSNITSLGLSSSSRTRSASAPSGTRQVSYPAEDKDTCSRWREIGLSSATRTFTMSLCSISLLAAAQRPGLLKSLAAASEALQRLLQPFDLSHEQSVGVLRTC